MKRAILIMLLLLTACGERDRYARPARDGERVFYGDSITELCAPRLNRGYGGYQSADILPEVQYYAQRDGEAQYFVLIGINDIAMGNDGEYIHNMSKIFLALSGRDVTVTGILPTLIPEFNERVILRNAELRGLTSIYGFTYRDMSDKIKRHHYSDSVHLNREGCEVLYGG